MSLTKKSNKKKSFQVGDVWFDPRVEDYYLITAIDKKCIYGVFLDTEITFSQLKKYCDEDEYVRKITKLELELYDTDREFDVF
jgi:hypothetical protein